MHIYCLPTKYFLWAETEGSRSIRANTRVHRSKSLEEEANIKRKGLNSWNNVFSVLDNKGNVPQK